MPIRDGNVYAIETIVVNKDSPKNAQMHCSRGGLELSARRNTYIYSEYLLDKS